MSKNDTGSLEGSHDSSTKHELTAADHADAALRDLDVGTRIEGPTATAEVQVPQTAESLITVSRERLGGLDDDPVALTTVTLEGATEAGGTSRTTLLLDEGDAEAVRELADTLEVAADWLEGDDE